MSFPRTQLSTRTSHPRVRCSHSPASSCPGLGGRAYWVEVDSGWLGAWAGAEPPPRRPPTGNGCPLSPQRPQVEPRAWLRCRVLPFPLAHPWSCRGVWAARAASTTEASLARCRVTISGTQLAAGPSCTQWGRGWPSRRSSTVRALRQRAQCPRRGGCCGATSASGHSEGRCGQSRHPQPPDSSRPRTAPAPAAHRCPPGRVSPRTQASVQIVKPDLKQAAEASVLLNQVSTF